ADLRQLLRFRRLVPRQQHEHQPEPECHAQQKKHPCDPASVPRAVRRRSADASHLMLVDKSQVIALDLIRRKIMEMADDLIRCKFSIDAKLWRSRAPVPYPPIRNHNGGAV